MAEHEFEVGGEVRLPFTAKASVRYKVRWTRRAEQFLNDTCVSAGMPAEAIETQMLENERLDDLMLEGINKAARVSDPEYRAALARLVASAFTDDARVDEVEQLAGQLVSLDAFALRVLREAYTDHQGGLIPYPSRSISLWGLSSRLAADEAPIQGALARLAGLGLVSGTPTSEHISRAVADGGMAHLQDRDGYWTTTSWGARAVELCYQQLQGDSEPRP